MVDEYDANAGGNRGSLLTVILANVLWTLRLQELMKQRVLWNVYASVFSRLSLSDWVSRCRIRLVSSNFGTSTGTICVLFDDSCSYGDGNTLSSSLIDNQQFETDINTSFVDSDSWPGLRVCAAVDGRRSSTSSTWSRWCRPHRFVRICLAFNWFESICLLFTVYDYCTIKHDMFIILKYNTHRVDRWSLFQPNTRVTQIFTILHNHMLLHQYPVSTMNIPCCWIVHHLKAYSIFYNLLI